MAASYVRIMGWVLLGICIGHLLPGLETYLTVNSTTGATVLLPCHGRPLNDAEGLLWIFNGKPASTFEIGNFCENGHHVNRTSIQSIQQQNYSLLIIDVRKEDAGVYTCRISRQQGTASVEDIQSIHLFVYDAETNQEQRAAVTQQDDAETDQDQRAAVTQQGGSGHPFCRPYREREDPPGSLSRGSPVDTVRIVVAVVGFWGFLGFLGVVVFIIRRRKGQITVYWTCPNNAPVIQ